MQTGQTDGRSGNSRGIHSWPQRHRQSEKYGAGAHKVEHDWMKAHCMFGVKTNVVTAVEVTPRNAQDSPQFPALVEQTTANFNVDEISGDKAYSSMANLELVRAKGATPFIPFKSYAVQSGKSATWDKLLGFFLMNREEFLASYHKRSNAESGFSAIKRVFGDFVRSRTPVAMVNEVLLKVLCHNLRCLVHAMYELGIDPSFCAAPVSAQKVMRLC